MIDLTPPPLVLPTYFEGKHPAIVRHEAKPLEHFPAILPGIAPLIVGSGPPEVGSLSFVASAVAGSTGTGSVSVTLPGTAAAGDLCIWMQDLFGSSVTNSVPADFSSLDAKGISSTGHATQWGYKVLVGGDVGASKTGGSADAGGTTHKSAVALVFRPDVAISSVALGAAINDEDTSGNPAAQAVNVSGSTAVLIVLGHFMSTAAVTPRTSSPAMNEVLGGLNRQYVHYTLTPDNYSIDMGDNGSNRLQSGYIVVT